MSKHSGLSQLADAATEMISPRLAHYPVRRKGERRRLNPNQAGIDWLEGRCTDGEDFLGDTEIVEFDVAVDGLQSYLTSGWYAAKRGGNYARPMFQVFGMEASSSAEIPYTPCPDCDNWARTSKCETHHDLDGVAGLSMGAERASAGRAHTAHTPLGLWAERVADQVANAIIEVNGEILQGAVSLQFETPRGVDRGQETITYYS